MFNRLLVVFSVLCCFSSNASAFNDNPFAKNESLNIGKDTPWKLDKDAGMATKSATDGKGNYYHLKFDNKEIQLNITTDEAGVEPKVFTQLEIKDLFIDGKQSPLFKWCLKNQQRHDRFLQQGLTVKKDICMIDGGKGSFVMRLNKATLASLQAGKRLTLMLKPFRTPLELNYDISDFKDMYLALNAKVPADAPVASTSKQAPVSKKCWAGPPARYKTIKPVEYDCADAEAKRDAEAWVTGLVNKEKAEQKKLADKKAAALAAEKEKQRKIAEQKRQKELAAKQAEEEKLRIEAAALAASEVKQAKINDEITQKMVNVCSKFWNKGEHRCYCQKYIDHAPSSIQASSTCE